MILPRTYDAGKKKAKDKGAYWTISIES